MIGRCVIHSRNFQTKFADDRQNGTLEWPTTTMIYASNDIAVRNASGKGGVMKITNSRKNTLAVEFSHAEHVKRRRTSISDYVKCSFCVESERSVFVWYPQYRRVIIFRYCIRPNSTTDMHVRVICVLCILCVAHTDPKPTRACGRAAHGNIARNGTKYYAIRL